MVSLMKYEIQMETKKFTQILIVCLLLMVACNTKEKNAAEEKSQNVSHGYNELADSTNRETYSISDYNADNPDVKNIDRPERSTVKTEIDTTLLFGIWVSNLDAPHADFDITSSYFRVADYDGNGDMPYELTGNHIKIYYNDFIQEGKIISVAQDTLQVQWKGFGYINKYLRWKE